MRNRVVARRRTIYETSLLAVGIYAALGPWINPSVALAVPVRIDLMALALLGAWALVPGWETVGGTRCGARRWEGEGLGLPVKLPWIVAGGLLGTAFVAPWAAFPWLVVPAITVAWVCMRRGHPAARTGSGLAVALLVAVANCSLVAAVSARGFRVAPEEFAAKDFRVNTLLAEVPLHDVWAIDLKGHPPATLAEVGNAFKRGSPLQANPALLGLSVLRGAVGFALGWEDPRWFDEKTSFVNRLAEADRRQSTARPGTTLGIWRVLYACPQEGVVETMNGTAHVAVAASVGEGPEGPRLFLSFRVREVNWTTRFYMRLIDPARRFFVYPSLLRQFAHTWEREGWKAGEETRIGERQ